jgi:hypothetical protein
VDSIATDLSASGLRVDSAIDPETVAMIAFAIDRLGPASMKASWIGRPVEINVPDAATAALFRAALDVTGRRRSTDRLITITCPTEGRAA